MIIICVMIVVSWLVTLLFLIITDQNVVSVVGVISMYLELKGVCGSLEDGCVSIACGILLLVIQLKAGVRSVMTN